MENNSGDIIKQEPDAKGFCFFPEDIVYDPDLDLFLETENDKSKLNKFECEVCHKKYKTKGILTEHQKSHDKDWKGYQCKVCQKYLSDRTNLARHMKLHKPREKTFACDMCDSKYFYNFLLTNHKRTVHQEDFTPNQCHLCGKEIVDKENFKRHMLLHDDSFGGYPCKFCHKKFLDKSYLIKHEKTHNVGFEGYKCDICEKVYTQKQTMILHKKKHHPES
jgi:KRAB domain-containing zinc finger protein